MIRKFIPFWLISGLFLSSCFLPLQTVNNVDDVYTRRDEMLKSEVYAQTTTNSTSQQQTNVYRENTMYIVKNGILVPFNCPCDSTVNAKKADTLYYFDTTKVKYQREYYQEPDTRRQERVIIQDNRNRTERSTDRNPSPSNNQSSTPPAKVSPPAPPSRPAPPPSKVTPSRPAPRP